MHCKAISFRGDIDPIEFGGIKNLCICSREINSVKNILNEKEFMKKIKKN